MEGNPYTEIPISGVEKKIVITSKIGTTTIIPIECDVKQWSSLYVEYNGYESKPTEYKYTVKYGDSKTISGSFSLTFSDMAIYCFTIGSRCNNTRFLKGDIFSLEIYHVNKTSEPFPECLKILVINNHVLKTPSS